MIKNLCHVKKTNHCATIVFVVKKTSKLSFVKREEKAEKRENIRIMFSFPCNQQTHFLFAKVEPEPILNTKEIQFDYATNMFWAAGESA